MTAPTDNAAAEGTFTGSVLVARDGAVLDIRCDGLADRSRGLAWTAATPSQLASISKQFVAVVALLLADRGVLALDDAVPRHLPQAPPHWRDVTLRQLMTHTAGVDHWSEAPGFDPSETVTSVERLALLLDAPLRSTPGTGWHYSSPGYIVLASALGAAAGRLYPELVDEFVLGPLALDGTRVGEPAVAGAAVGYRGGEPVDPWQLHSMPGTGDVWSSVSDVERFVTALHTGALLPGGAQEEFRRMRVALPSAPAADAALATTAYGCGHFHGSVLGDDARLHPGDNPGYLSVAVWLPRTRTTIVALSNDEHSDIERAVADAARDAPPPDSLPTCWTPRTTTI